MTGGTGFIGSALAAQLLELGHELLILTRNLGHMDSDNLSYINSLDSIHEEDYFECFINLAGENIAEKRWTEARKSALLSSRIDTTRELFELARRLQRPPELVLSASAIGFYGNQQDQRLSEDAQSTEGFAPRLCQAWEDAALRFETLGCRVCRLRLGVVLAAEGGALEELTRSARMGVASWLGDGGQWLSWVHREDVIRAMLFLLEDADHSGAFNLTAPEPVTNRAFCDELRQHMRTWLAMPVPGFVMRIVFGEMAEELLLNGQRVIPRRLQEAGFNFRYDTLAEAMPSLVAR